MQIEIKGFYTEKRRNTHRGFRGWIERQLFGNRTTVTEIDQVIPLDLKGSGAFRRTLLPGLVFRGNLSGKRIDLGLDLNNFTLWQESIGFSFKKPTELEIDESWQGLSFQGVVRLTDQTPDGENG